MNNHRARAQDLCMNDAMPFQQQFQYRTTLPLGEIVHDRFFLPVAGNLRRGDQIRLISYDRPGHDGRVVEVADIVVVDKRPNAVEVALLGEIRNIVAPGATATAPEQSTPRERYVSGDAKVVWNISKRAFDIRIGDSVVATAPDKGKAMQIARGDIPLPSGSEAA